MRFLLDENLPFSLSEFLEEKGFEVEHVKKIISLRGSSDKKIAEYARKRESVLITKDVEFGSIILYPKTSHYGLIVLRLPYYYTAEQIVKTIKEFFDIIEVNELISARIVLELGKYRRRRF